MSATEERQELKRVAAEVQGELQKFTKRVHMLINKVLSEADRLMIEAADERSSGDQVLVTKVKFGAREDQKAAAVGAPSPGVLPPGKRACSICRQPGHRSTTCPQADKKYKADRKGKK